MKLFQFHPGETFVLNFVLPFNKYDVSHVVLSFRDRDRVAFETKASSFKVESTPEEEEEGIYKLRVGYVFTQSESLMFDENKTYFMQLNVFGPNSSRATSREIEVHTLSQQILDPGVISGPAIAGSVNIDTHKQNITSYDDLTNKPKINNIELIGNRILPEQRITETQIDTIMSISDV